MKKGLIFYFNILFILFTMSTSSFAQEILSDFGYSKTIVINGENKYKSVFLDSDVYKHSNENLGDIRIVDNDKNFVPFYLSSGYSNLVETNLVYTSNRVFTYKKDGTTYFDFEVFPQKYNADIVGNKLYLEVNSSEYLKDVVVYGSYDRNEWDYLITDRIYSVQNILHNYIKLPSIQRYKYYRIGVIDNVEKLQITSLELENNNFETISENYEEVGSLEYEIQNIKNETFITLKNVNNLKINSIHLDIEGVFKRKYDILIKFEDDFIKSIVSGELYNLSFKSSNVKNTSIEFIEPISKDIQIKIYNYDDAPLKINDIKIGYYVDKLVFEADKDKTYKLFFGNVYAKAPSYDIETMKSFIEKEAQDKCDLEQLEKLKSNIEIRDYNYELIFNIVMIIVSIILVIFIAMKFKTKTN